MNRPPAPACTARRDAQSAAPIRSPIRFFLLVFALSVPFWLVGVMTDLQLMPGLSVSALMTFCPVTAALILVHRESGVAGQAKLLGRAFDFKRVKAKRWYVPVLLLMAGINVAVYGLMRWMDLPLPAPRIQLPAAALMLVAFFVGALGEELGWSGYITGPLQQRWSALQTGLLLGLAGVLWHLVPLLLSHRSPSWIAWWCLYAVAARIFIVWLYNNMGQSVFGVALFHATMNLSWMLFPVDGSHFDIRLGGLLMAVTAAIVVAVWGPSTLTRHQEG
jgi:membrane protease YdiL (CAAX protease family)